MKIYFADTSYYIALLVPQDRAHAAAAGLASRRDIRMITTHYVLIELASYFAKPPLRASVVALVEELRLVDELTILPEDETLFDLGWAAYARHRDKSWSLVDCISFEVMRDREIKEALTTDHHYEQAGFPALR